MDFSNFEFHKDKIPSDGKEQEKFFEELKEKFLNEIKTSSKASEFLKDYNPDTIDSFIGYYAERKAQLAKNYEYYADRKQKKVLMFRDKAEKAFEAILQKKLFDLQLKWRAEKIVIKEITFSNDFTFWGDHISDCHFLPPVIPEEIEIMKLFLKEKDAYESLRLTYGWQDYYQDTDEDDSPDEDLPEWYNFYNDKMGTGFLLLLPNIRGEKEDFYKEIAFEEQRKKIEEERAKIPEKPYVPARPSLYYDVEKMVEFAQLFETDKHFIELFEVNWEETKKTAFYNRDVELMESALDLLENAEETIIMPGGLPWREAIVRCAQGYESQLISNELDTLYSEYCMLNELGISRGSTNEELKKKYEEDHRVQWIRAKILRGRELCGEPADFNF